MTPLLLLFSLAFAAATFLPLSSELYLAVLIKQGYSVTLVVIVAGIGNTLGSLVNWWLGRHLRRFEKRRWFYFKPEQIQSAEQYFKRFGLWSLLFAWVPVIGDGLTLVAGILRVHWLPFLVLVGAGKLVRYAAIAGLLQPL